MKIVQIQKYRTGSFKCSIFWWTDVSENDWYSNGYELCSATRRVVFTYLSGKLFSRVSKYWKLAQTLNSSFLYIDDIQSLNNFWFGDYLHCIYPNELEVKDTTDTEKSASYLDIHHEIDNRGILKKTLRQTWWLHFSNSQLPFH